MSTTTDPVGMLQRELDAAQAIRDALETEWYNGNLAEDVYDRIMAKAVSGMPSGSPEERHVRGSHWRRYDAKCSFCRWWLEENGVKARR